MSKSLNKLLFDMWMNNNHPHFHAILGLIIILLMLIGVVSLILAFFNIEWWWKLLLLSIGLFIFVKVIGKAILLHYVDEYKSKK